MRGIVSRKSQIFHTRTLFVFLILITVFFFFYNLAIYSDKICEQQMELLEREKNELNAKLISLSQNAEERRQKLENENEEVHKQNEELRKRLQKALADSNIAVEEPSQETTKEIQTTTGLQHRTQNQPPIKSNKKKIPVIIFAYNRPHYLKRTLDSVLKYVDERFEIFVSQDGSIPEVTELIKSYSRVKHLHKPERPPILNKIMSQTESDSYYYIAMHYKFGLSKLFDELDYDKAIILEDDLEISPDFYDYFYYTSNLLEEDETLFCVSAWNDNGQEHFVKESRRLWRSNFFPGLGWMLTKKLWEEIRNKWPRAYWDDWLREPQQRKERDCIHPEISRTYTFGESGSSLGQFYEKYLKNIKLNNEKIDWSKEELGYLKKDDWDSFFDRLLIEAKKNPINNRNEISTYKSKILWMPYSGFEDFQIKADMFGVMNDWKAGVPRTGYRGVVVFHINSNTVLLGPE